MAHQSARIPDEHNDILDEADYDLGDSNEISREMAGTDRVSFSNRHLRTLAAALDFTEDDLIANRAGQLTPEQIDRLAHDLRWVYWAPIGILSAGAFMLGTAGIMAGAPLMAIFLTFALFLMLAAMIGAAVMRHELDTLPDRPVRSTPLYMGRLALILHRWGISGDEKRAKFNIENSDKKLFAGRHLYKILKANQRYRAYYVPVRLWHDYRLLSMEPTGQPDGEDNITWAEKLKRDRPRRGKLKRRGWWE